MSDALKANLTGQIVRLDPRRRVATAAVPSVGRGRSFRADYAAPGKAIAAVMEHVHGWPNSRSVGSVVAVRPTARGAEVGLQVNDAAWQRLGEREARVAVHCAFTGSVGPDPVGGRVDRVEIS